MKKLLFPIILMLFICICLVPTAHATTESSYKYGYKQGKENWVGCTDPGDKYGNTMSCVSAGDVCSQPIMGVAYNSAAKENMQVVVGHIDNVTACMHGYMLQPPCLESSL